jgi:hypothetical protein
VWVRGVYHSKSEPRNAAGQTQLVLQEEELKVLLEEAEQTAVP